MSDRLLFFRQLLSKPKQISAISPSSPWLARAVAKGLGPDTGKVVEFGPGTGALTRGILAAGVAARDLTVFEMDADFVQRMENPVRSMPQKQRNDRENETFADEILGKRQHFRIAHRAGGQ